VVFSVCYDWGFFRVFGPHFFLGLSINDHISSAIDRLPYFVLLLAFEIFAILFTFKYFRPSNIQRADKTPKSLSQKIFRFGNLFIATLISFSLFQNEWDFLLIAIFFILTIVWATRTFFRTSLTRLAFAYTGLYILFITLAPVVVGHVLAMRELVRKHGDHILILKDGEAISDASVLRFTGSAILFRDHGRAETRLISWPSIKEIRYKHKYEPSAPSCRILGICIRES
jgi:hypothetical protein